MFLLPEAVANIVWYHIEVQVGEVGKKANNYANKTRQEGEAGLSWIETVKWWEYQGKDLEECVEDAVEVSCVEVDKEDGWVLQHDL